MPVLAAQPKPVPAPTAKISPMMVHAAPVRHVTPPKQIASASAAHVAPVASSFAPGEDVFAHPPYPEEARERGEIGTVKVNVRFDTQGGVADVEITQSSGSLILDHHTAIFIRTNWHSVAEAGRAGRQRAGALFAREFVNVVRSSAAAALGRSRASSKFDLRLFFVPGGASSK